MRKLLLITGLSLAVFSGIGFSNAHAGKIIVNNDEWTFTDFGFANLLDTATFAVNVAEFLAGSPPASLHAYSNNFGFTGGTLAATLTTAGYTYTTGTGFPFTLANLSSYKALFLGGTYLTAGEISTLIAYVNGGGSVYLAGGTGVGGSAAEAAAWNPFLNAFGLSFDSTYNGIQGVIIVSGHAIFTDVTALYQNNGNSISGTGVVCCAGFGGLYAVVETVKNVVIDIKPGSFPNSINLGSAGVVPVAILSSPTFDATQVDPATVTLAGAQVRLIGKGDKYGCHAEDVNGDGLLDLVCEVMTAQFLVEPGDSVAVLEAKTFSGQQIRGQDSIRIVP